MKSSFGTILLLLCLGLAHGGRDNYGFNYSDDDYCIYEFISMKPNTVMTTDECVKLTCDHTTTMIIDTCPTLTCNEDEEIVQLPSRSDTLHPYCCRNIYCRRRQRVVE